MNRSILPIFLTITVSLSIIAMDNENQNQGQEKIQYTRKYMLKLSEKSPFLDAKTIIMLKKNDIFKDPIATNSIKYQKSKNKLTDSYQKYLDFDNYVIPRPKKLKKLKFFYNLNGKFFYNLNGPSKDILYEFEGNNEPPESSDSSSKPERKKLTVGDFIVTKTRKRRNK